MKKFNYFLLTLVIFIFTPIESSAFTTTLTNSTNIEQVNDLNPILTLEHLQFSPIPTILSENRELHFSSASSVSVMENNLTLLYSICIALVLFNLAAQIKIIYQMVNLFFLFQKKDEFSVHNFC